MVGRAFFRYKTRIRFEGSRVKMFLKRGGEEKTTEILVFFGDALTRIQDNLMEEGG